MIFNVDSVIWERVEAKTLRSGVEIDVAEILGHSRIETKEKYYISNYKESRKEATEFLEKQINSETIKNIIEY